jgi:hypothetical protein
MGKGYRLAYILNQEKARESMKQPHNGVMFCASLDKIVENIPIENWVYASSSKAVGMQTETLFSKKGLLSICKNIDPPYVTEIELLALTRESLKEMTEGLGLPHNINHVKMDY